jgi:starvation-inducible DNA-binding protein
MLFDRERRREVEQVPGKRMPNENHGGPNGSSFWTVDIGEGTTKIVLALNTLLADLFTLYFKTKNFYWHMSGPHFRDYRVLLNEQAEEILATTNAIAERVRKLGEATLRSVEQVSRLRRLTGNEADFVAPLPMLAELRGDNERLIALMRDAHFVCGEYDDLASMSLLENCIGEGEQRAWFLFECGREA